MLWGGLTQSRDAVKTRKHFSNTCVTLRQLSQEVTAPGITKVRSSPWLFVIESTTMRCFSWKLWPERVQQLSWPKSASQIYCCELLKCCLCSGCSQLPAPPHPRTWSVFVVIFVGCIDIFWQDIPPRWLKEIKQIFSSFRSVVKCGKLHLLRKKPHFLHSVRQQQIVLSKVQEKRKAQLFSPLSLRIFLFQFHILV